MSKHGKYLLLLAGLLLATSCVDDPVSVDEQPVEAAGDLPVQAQYQPKEDPDPFRARLKVDFRVVGELSPNTPITVWIEAEATEQITGGEVEVALPTFAAMKLAGPDKALQYVKGGKAPAVASWKLPALEVGDTWKQTVEIGTIADKGYYQVTAVIRAHGPFESPYVFDESFREAWMFVMDGGGFLTRMFDESVFPEQLIPQPGPFQSWHKFETAGVASDGANAGSMSSAGAPSRISVEFLTEGRRGRNIPMVGAEIRAEYMERGQVVSTTTRTVPVNGIVEFNCPGDDQRISGSAKNSTTSRVYGGHLLSNWQANQSDCGRRMQVHGARHHYLPWRNLEKFAIPRITSHFRYSRNAIRFKVDVDKDNASYSPTKDRIKFGEDYDRLRVAGHEYTHGLHNKALGGTWFAEWTNCWGHRVNKPSSYQCALKEGLAIYGGYVGEQYSNELVNYRAPSGRAAGEIEGNVAALFQDLIDSGTETGDLTSYSGSYVMTVFKTCRTSAGKRDDTADFVWCLENRVDVDVHEDHFPSLSAPSNPKEYASEPADWDADDIRSTWLRNVG